MGAKIGQKSSKMFPRTLLFGSLVFDTLPVSKISHFKASAPLKCAPRLSEVQKSTFSLILDFSQKSIIFGSKILSFLDTFGTKMEHGPLCFRCCFFTPFFGHFWPQCWSILAPIWNPGPPILAAKIVLGASLVVSWPAGAHNMAPDPICGEF